MNKAEIRQQLVDHYLDFYALAYSMLNDDSDARDAVQEALTRTMTKRHVDNALSYCYQSVRHTAINIMRHRQRFVQFDGQILDEAAKDEYNESYADMLERVMQLRDGLPKAMRALVRLHDEEGLTYAELAKLTGMSRMTIRRRLNEIHAEMREKLERNENTII
ncbi:MAG: sigma-70 family RNA polymerase sigma factor [Bacteroidales bacterium]|nr:sigma-70 family RNA polymerase sigma factor [Bacteroidales bacterium]